MRRRDGAACRLLAAVALVATIPSASIAQTEPTLGTITLDPAHALVWLPMMGDRQRTIVVPIKVNGQWLSAAIDTGAGGDYGLELSTAAAKRLGLTLQDGPSVRTYTGEMHEQATTVTEFQFGALDVKGLSVEVVPYGRPYDATIGMTVLRQGTLQVDSVAHRVRFLFPGELGRSEVAGASVQVTLDAKQHASIPARLCGKPVSLMLDTGDNNDLALNEATMRAAACRSAVISDNKASDAADRQHVEPFVSLSSLAVAGVELGAVLANGMPAPPHPGGPPFPDTIGLGALHRTDFALDLASGRLALYGPVRPDQAELRPRVGLQVREVSDHLLVTHVRRGSPAAASVLHEGDTICSLDGRPIAAWHGSWTLNPPLGQQLLLKTCDGRTAAIMPADFLAPLPGPAPKAAPLPFPATFGALTRAMNSCENGKEQSKIAGCTAALDLSAPGFNLRPLIMIFRGQAEEGLGQVAAAIADYRAALALGASAPWLTAHLSELAGGAINKPAEHH